MLLSGREQRRSVDGDRLKEFGGGSPQLFSHPDRSNAAFAQLMEEYVGEAGP